MKKRLCNNQIKDVKDIGTGKTQGNREKYKELDLRDVYGGRCKSGGMACM